MEKIIYRPCEEGPTTPHRTNDWGKAEYAHCVQPYTWRELVYGYKNSSVIFKAGGLGKLLEKGGYQTWQCFPDHYCATDASDPWFCFVYHETEKVFTPWGENSRLELVMRKDISEDIGQTVEAQCMRNGLGLVCVSCNRPELRTKMVCRPMWRECRDLEGRGFEDDPRLEHSLRGNKNLIPMRLSIVRPQVCIDRDCKSLVGAPQV